MFSISDAIGDRHFGAPNSSGTAGGQHSTLLVRVIVAFAAVYLVWGSTFLGIRIAIESIPPLLMAGVRWLVAGAVLYALLRWRGAPRPAARDWPPAAIIGSGIIFAGNGTVTYAEQFIPSGTVAVLVAVVPALMALLGWLSGVTARPGIAVWMGIALATAGIAIIMMPEAGPAQSGHAYILVLLVVAQLAWSAASLYAVRARQASPAFLAAAMQMLCAGGLMLMVALARGEFSQLELAAVTGRSIAAMSYLTFIGSIVGFSAYLWLLRNVDSTKVATYAFVNPVVAVFLGWLLLGEKPMPALIGGSALVVCGVALIVIFRARAPVRTCGESLITAGKVGPQTLR